MIKISGMQIHSEPLKKNILTFTLLGSFLTLTGWTRYYKEMHGNELPYMYWSRQRAVKVRHTVLHFVKPLAHHIENSNHQNLGGEHHSKTKNDISFRDFSCGLIISHQIASLFYHFPCNAFKNKGQIKRLIFPLKENLNPSRLLFQ